MEILPELRDFVRHEPNLASGTLVVRGGPDTADKLTAHAERLQRAYVLDGAAVLGVSAFAALDDIGSASLDGIYGERLSTYRYVHVAQVSRVKEAGFGLIPTFKRPHVTILMNELDDIDTLLDVLGQPRPNPQYGGSRSRPRRRPR